MRVFVTGANGWVGSALVPELIAAGHQVAGLVRSETKAGALRAAGGEPVLGSLDDLATLRRAADAADGVVHLAFGLDFSKLDEMAWQEQQVITAFGEVYAGSQRSVIMTSGFGLLPAGETFTEDTLSALNVPGFARDPEQAGRAIAERGVHAAWVRLPRSVHGVGETHGFIPMLANLAREKGISAYVGDGENLWPSVHRLDAARVFRLALERGGHGGPWHAVADEGVPFRQIAGAIGELLGVPTRSVAPEEAARHFGPLAMWAAGNGPASSARTRELLAWTPEQPSLLQDISRPEYYSALQIR